MGTLCVCRSACCDRFSHIRWLSPHKRGEGCKHRVDSMGARFGRMRPYCQNGRRQVRKRGPRASATVPGVVGGWLRLRNQTARKQRHVRYDESHGFGLCEFVPPCVLAALHATANELRRPPTSRLHIEWLFGRARGVEQRTVGGVRNATCS